jgi:hypothetical protein
MYKKEKDNWKEICGFNSPGYNKYNKSKSDSHLDLNATQTVNLAHLSIKRKTKSKNPRSKTQESISKLCLPAIHEKHNTYHSSKSPVMRQSQSQFKKKQVEARKPESLFHGFLLGEYSGCCRLYTNMLVTMHVILLAIVINVIMLCFVCNIIAKGKI